MPWDELFAWHERPGAFERLTPPWDEVELVERSGGIAVGARTVIRVPMGPMKRTWVAHHTAYEKGRLFRDEQVEGPFAKWIHTHHFERIDLLSDAHRAESRGHRATRSRGHDQPR